MNKVRNRRSGMSRRRFIGTGAAGLAAAGMAGSGVAVAVKPPQVYVKDVVIGFITKPTGGFADNYLADIESFYNAVCEFNRYSHVSGIYAIPEVRTTTSSGELAFLAEELAGIGAVGIVHDVISSDSLVIAPVTDKYGIVTCSVAATTELANTNREYYKGGKGFFIRATIDSPGWGEFGTTAFADLGGWTDPEDPDYDEVVFIKRVLTNAPDPPTSEDQEDPFSKGTRVGEFGDPNAGFEGLLGIPDKPIENAYYHRGWTTVNQYKAGISNILSYYPNVKYIVGAFSTTELKRLLQAWYELYGTGPTPQGKNVKFISFGTLSAGGTGGWDFVSGSIPFEAHNLVQIGRFRGCEPALPPETNTGYKKWDAVWNSYFETNDCYENTWELLWDKQARTYDATMMMLGAIAETGGASRKGLRDAMIDVSKPPGIMVYPDGAEKLHLLSFARRDAVDYVGGTGPLDILSDSSVPRTFGEIKGLYMGKWYLVGSGPAVITPVYYEI